VAAEDSGAAFFVASARAGSAAELYLRKRNKLHNLFKILSEYEIRNSLKHWLNTPLPQKCIVKSCDEVYVN
jgi:hypothetical protein